MLARLGNKKGFYAQCPDCTRVHFVTDEGKNTDRRCPEHKALHDAAQEVIDSLRVIG